MGILSNKFVGIFFGANAAIVGLLLGGSQLAQAKGSSEKNQAFELKKSIVLQLKQQIELHKGMNLSEIQEDLQRKTLQNLEFLKSQGKVTAEAMASFDEGFKAIDQIENKEELIESEMELLKKTVSAKAKNYMFIASRAYWASLLDGLSDVSSSNFDDRSFFFFNNMAKNERIAVGLAIGTLGVFPIFCGVFDLVTLPITGTFTVVSVAQQR